MEKKKSKTRMIIVLLFIAIFAICSYVSLRGTYLQYKELGENYIQAFETNLKCKYIIFGINFVLLYIIMYFTNRGIKKGLKPFFEKEKKEMVEQINIICNISNCKHISIKYTYEAISIVCK